MKKEAEGRWHPIAWCPWQDRAGRVTGPACAEGIGFSPSINYRPLGIGSEKKSRSGFAGRGWVGYRRRCSAKRVEAVHGAQPDFHEKRGPKNDGLLRQPYLSPQQREFTFPLGCPAAN